eukprot:c4110_g1_i1.p1 GENE.c4110_g1_i1~~c4110_g1_i1.p1  ORF type:complete len:176 (+),score=3.07 c4110_g1_i1:789-1316(+)
MGRERFECIHSCLVFILEVERTANVHNQVLSNSGNVAVVDELLVPNKGKNNPHHVFIHVSHIQLGLRFVSFLVEFLSLLHTISTTTPFRIGRSSIIAGSPWDSIFSPEKRPEGEVRSDTGENGKVCPKGTLIVCDSYFGSVFGAETIVELGQEFLFSCLKDRPAWLFSKYLCFKP